MITLLKDAWAGVAACKEIAAAQLAGNFVLLALLYWWFGLSVATVPKLVLVALTAAALVAGSAWLHGAGLAALSGRDVREAFTVSLQSLLKLSAYACVIIFALIAWDQTLAGQQRIDNWTASLLTRLSQKPVSPASIAWILPWKLRAWFVLLGLALLPFAAQSVGSVESAKAVLRKPAWWILGVLLAFTGLYLPYRLIHWVPVSGSLVSELLSALVRFTLAYALAVASWLTAASLLARIGRPHSS
jgi:hypothetical protein